MLPPCRFFLTNGRAGFPLSRPYSFSSSLRPPLNRRTAPSPLGPNGQAGRAFRFGGRPPGEPLPAGLGSQPAISQRTEHPRPDARFLTPSSGVHQAGYWSRPLPWRGVALFVMKPQTVPDHQLVRGFRCRPIGGRVPAPPAARRGFARRAGCPTARRRAGFRPAAQPLGSLYRSIHGPTLDGRRSGLDAPRPRRSTGTTTRKVTGWRQTAGPNPTPIRRCTRCARPK